MRRGGTYVAGMRTPFDSPIALGTAAKKARLNAGLTQSQLAGEIGTTRKRIGNIESGDTATLGKTPEEWFAAVAPIAAASWKIDPADRKRNRYWDGGDWGGESITPVELMKRKRQASEGDKPQVVVNNRGCGSGCAGTFAVFLVIGLIAMVLEKC